MSSLYVKATLVLPGSYSTKRYILFITALQRIIYHEQIVGKNKWSNCCDYSRFGQRHAIINKIRDAFKTYELPSQVRIYSVHKQASELIQVLKSYNTFTFPLVIVGVAGGTDALSGIASFHSAFPVLSCPSDGINATCLTNPPEVQMHL